jgi:two-component system, NarL family, nitrate/nitrite response regulator NarL
LSNTALTSIFICDTEPVAIRGLCSILENHPHLQVCGFNNTLPEAAALVEALQPKLVLVDKAFGNRAIAEWIEGFRQRGQSMDLIVWGFSINATEALRFVKSGAQGIIRKTTDLESLQACLETVAEGRNWVEGTVLRGNLAALHSHYRKLTARELQVLELVERGMRNKDIADALGIEPGTVKVHLKHIFEKTGVHGRYDLVVAALKNKPVETLTTM